MIYRAVKFKSQPSLVYVLESSDAYDVEDELMISSLLMSAGMLGQMMFSQDPRENLEAIKKFWPEAKQVFYFNRSSILYFECPACGAKLPRCGGTARDTVLCACSAGKKMFGTAYIEALPWSN